ncbi:MAG: FAD-dependent oxidoreductase [Deltaproteobacteria bacterium]
MSHDETPGTERRPVRVAIVGAGPAGFFTAEALLRRDAPVFEVDVYERLPTPFGLVRAGVAPDHQKIKSVTRTFEKTARNERFRFLGNVEVGRDVTHAELAAHYDQVVYAVGSSSDRRLGVPGEELTDCHAATAFVGWYNAHPDFRDFAFDLSARRAVIVGVGNVALDIARVLLRSPDDLAKTDIAAHAIEALRASRVREVVVLARRGPGQVAFTPGELEDIADIDGVGVVMDAAQVEAEMARLDTLDGPARRCVEVMHAVAGAAPRVTERTLRFEFCASPVEVLGREGQRVRAVRVERNELLRTPEAVKARGTGEFFEIEAGLVFRSIGYFGVPVPGVPFDVKAGVIPNRDGRVTTSPGGEVQPGTYAVGWIRRGPLGVIGTNKADATAVAEKMVEDVGSMRPTGPEPRRHAVDALLAARNARVTTYTDWAFVDALEVAAGREAGKVREKFTSVETMMDALMRASPRPAD